MVADVVATVGLGRRHSGGVRGEHREAPEGQRLGKVADVVVVPAVVRRSGGGRRSSGGWWCESMVEEMAVRQRLKMVERMV
ncbi:hypothetical protein Tco_1143158 [Tanacetum coccineum]